MRSTIKRPTDEEADLSGFQLFKKLTDQEFAQLNFDKTCSLYKKGNIIYREGSRLTGFYCITRGILKIFKTGIDGKEQIIRFVKKGDIIAYRSLLSQELACTTAKVIDEAVLCHIPYQTLLYLIQNNWQFSHHMLQIVCRELREANDYITDIAQKTVRERLAEVLLLLKDNFNLDNTNTLQISLTREELANMVGTATESVIRLLSEFKQDKLIDLQGRKIKFLDVPKLNRVANL
ncbi:MAG: Crp/Fnr family transcriptional regulator [Bacteroidetes bacterium GWF2_42_66]|nr:MAG: Crp/Fnr family transcriptional regulator [Bacteroidetes bacterium GWA2_42_15]OFX97938.1 MAG: Crp/Fnr family transcriptional regulator [Bacteroidetes bacterium GWE2_42_39]OFY45825.1 MAG: Crp/Fnr family transcriptional regulator [Bacteroidetes bacterium GWF2_42_66]HBL74674.1 Crp/Fnr family transcriptional regulator [Prolixibacteraceae bacterium]HCR89359.1 Crp/Fnr family transcriptional regulator [Prolixibacteraceae bacterium]